jgi:pimeloyl-ACP methyl ester carboxylesterase
MPTVMTNGIETYYETRGDGPPIVFVHGSLSDHTAADGQLAAFEDDFTAIAYDVRGHGQTSNPGDEPYSVDTLADDLHAFITALDLDRPVVCGVSMGGMIAQTHASRYPDDVSVLVLADTFTPAFLDRRDRLMRVTLMRFLMALLRLVSFERAKRLMLWIGRTIERNRTDSLRAEAFPAMATPAAINSLRAAARFHETEVDFRAITVPTLVLYGEHETAIMSRHAPVLARELSDATVREVPDAGHASPWDNPEFFNDAIETFVAERRESIAAPE